MSPITSSSVSSAPVTPATSTTSATNTAAGAAELQKQLQQQRQEVREKAKPVVEQVYISQQAQKQLATYAASAANAAARYDDDPSTSSSVSTNQVLDATQKIQNRQTAAAVAQYAKQQAEASPPKPEPREEAKPSASIKAIA